MNDEKKILQLNNDGWLMTNNRWERTDGRQQTTDDSWLMTEDLQKHADNWWLIYHVWWDNTCQLTDMAVYW